MMAIPRRLWRRVMSGRPGHRPMTTVTDRDVSRRRFSLAAQFLIASMLILFVGAVLIGAWVGRQIEHSVLNRVATLSALYVDSIISENLQTLADQPWLNNQTITNLDHVLTGTPLGEQIVAFKVWSTDGQVRYSTNRVLIGRSFPIRDELARALRGEIAVDLSDLSAPENEYERGRWKRLVEVYVPVREHGEGRIIAVTEFYQLPDELEGEVAAARWRSWAVVAAVMAGMYVVLAGIVKRGSDTITRQERALGAQVAELSRVVEQNRHLHERVQRAARRTTTLNEHARRQVSADLHDGPGQALSLALLRLDATDACRAAACPITDNLQAVRGAVQAALEETRAISAGLRLPELASRSVREVVERAVRDHERRAGVHVTTVTEDLPEQAPLAIKMALFRSLQEALSNATRHGVGDTVTVRVRCDGGRLCLAVSDRGPGFTPEGVPAEGHLGLVGMRERAELLGGSFRVESAIGRGTTVRASWPLDATDEADEGGQ